jgi:hypothetical protein
MLPQDGSRLMTLRFEALRGSALSPLVGRDEEIDLLMPAGNAPRGRPGAGLGEPGIGKSRVVAAFQCPRRSASIALPMPDVFSLGHSTSHIGAVAKSCRNHGSSTAGDAGSVASSGLAVNRHPVGAMNGGRTVLGSNREGLKFADSPVERARFELSVPRRR